MAVSFGVFARDYILTWNHLLSPYSFEFRGGTQELKPEKKTSAQFHAFIYASAAAGTSLMLNRSRTTVLMIAGGTALVTFYAVTGYFKWCLAQLPALAQRRPPPEVPVQRELRIASPGAPPTIEDFRQQPDWVNPWRTTNPSFDKTVTVLGLEDERAYFSSLWKRIYGSDINIVDHWADYLFLDGKLKNNTLKVEKGAPWEDFAKFAQKHTW